MINEIRKLNFFIYFKTIIGMEIFLAPFLFIFYNSYCKVSLSDFILIESIFFLAILILEIPLGYISDVLGRKKSFIFGNTLSAISLTIPVVFPSITGFILSLSLKAIGGSISSGILSTILYELYLEKSKITEYRKLMSNLAFIGLISSSVAALISGLLINNSIIIPIILDASLTAFASIFGIFLIQSHKNEITKLKTIKERIKIQALDLINTFPLYKKNFLLIIIISLIFALVRSSYSFYQPIFLNFKLESTTIAILFASFNIVSSISAFFSKYLFKNNNIINFFPIILSFISLSGLLLLENNIYFLISGIFIQQIYRGLYTSESNYIINSSITEKTKSRVTYLSISSALNLLLTSLFLGLLNFLSNVFSFSTILSILSFFISILILIYIAKMRREKNYAQNKIFT